MSSARTTTTADRLRSASDGVLAERAADGDTTAFETLVRRYLPLMRASVNRLLRSSADADDVVQETLVLAWRELPKLQDPTVVKSWLMRIAGRQAMTHLRRTARHDTDPLGEVALPTGTQPEQIAVRNAQMTALSVALDTLGGDQRECWLLREYAGLSYDEIAAEMGTSVSTVRGRIARARASIYTQMEGWR